MASSTSLPRNGFERNREAELLVTGGNLYTGEAQLSLGDHSESTAWYCQPHRLPLQLRPRHAGHRINHDATNSQSGFLSVIRNQTANDQLRLDAQYRQDFFQIPYDPDPND